MKKYIIVKYKDIYSVLKYIEYKHSVSYNKLFESTSKTECNEFIKKLEGGDEDGRK